MKTQQLSKQCFGKVETRGCNFGYVVTPAGVVMIDAPGDPVYLAEYKKELAGLGKVLYIINTEYHFDHNMTAGYFDAPIIASNITRQLFLISNTEHHIRQGTQGLYREPFTMPDMQIYRKGIPTITFSKQMTLSIGGLTFQIILTPGHTAGQTSVYIPEEKVLYASDNVTASGSIGPLHDVAPYQYLESLEYMQRLDINCIQTGHGLVVTSGAKECLRSMHAALQVRIAAVEKFKIDRLTVAQAAPLWDNMFVFETLPPWEGYRDYSPYFTAYQLNHLYHVIGGNTGT